MRVKRSEWTVIAVALSLVSVASGSWFGYVDACNRKYQALLDFHFTPPTYKSSSDGSISPQAHTAIAVGEDPEKFKADQKKDPSLRALGW